MPYVGNVCIFGNWAKISIIAKAGEIFCKLCSSPHFVDTLSPLLILYRKISPPASRSLKPPFSEVAQFWSGLVRAMQQCTQILRLTLLFHQCNKIVSSQRYHDVLISWVGFTKPNRATTEIFYLLFVNRLHELLLTRMSIMWDFFEPIYEVFIHLVWPQNGNCYPTIIPVNYPLSLCLHSVNIGYKTTSHFLFT